MPNNDVILRFNNVTFAHGRRKILSEVGFTVRRGTKLTLMGQNGAGKSTMFQMIIGTYQPEDGTISLEEGLSIAIARQASVTMVTENPRRAASSADQATQKSSASPHSASPRAPIVAR